MAMFAPAIPYLTSAALGGASVLGGRAAGKLASKLGFKKGGSTNPKAMSKALAKATVKKTGMRKIHANELVVPVGLAKQLKKVAKRKGVPIKPKKKGGKRKGKKK